MPQPDRPHRAAVRPTAIILVTIVSLAPALVARAVEPVASPVMATPAPAPLTSGTPCFKTLKFAGALYLDGDQAVPRAEVGEKVGETEPNPAVCGLPERLPVYRHAGHQATEEVVYLVDGGTAELFRSGGSTGYPYLDLLKWLVLVLVIGILLLAAAPAIVNHLRHPPIAVNDDNEQPPGPVVKGGHN